MKLKFVFSFAVLAILAACSSNDPKKQALKPADLVEFESTAKSKKVWSTSVGSGRDKRYSNFMPAVSERNIYVSDVDGRVFSVDRSTGKRNWKAKLKKKELSAGVGHFGSSLYVGTYDGELIALSAEDGSVLWEAETSSEILSVPAANDDVVVAQTIDGRLYAFDVKTGESRWRYDHIIPSLTVRGNASPVMTRTQLVAAFGNGQMVSLNPTDGAQLWSGRVSQPKGGNDLEKIVDIDGTPLIDSGLVYAATYQGAISAFSLNKGNAIWKQDISSYLGLTASSSKVISITEESHVVAFNAISGEIEWTNDALHRRNLSAPLAYGDYILAIDDDDYLHVMSEEDGSFVHRFKPSGDGFTAQPIVSDGRFILLSDDGTLSSYLLTK